MTQLPLFRCFNHMTTSLSTFGRGSIQSITNKERPVFYFDMDIQVLLYVWSMRAVWAMKRLFTSVYDHVSLQPELLLAAIKHLTTNNALNTTIEGRRRCGWQMRLMCQTSRLPSQHLPLKTTLYVSCWILCTTLGEPTKYFHSWTSFGRSKKYMFMENDDQALITTRNHFHYSQMMNSVRSLAILLK